ncbi:MAG TPA: response regulator [Thermoanaerobaculia bacterium]
MLVADDNEATCTLITALLQNDFVVDVAADGGEANDKLRTRKYDAVLLDLLMPNVDGYAVLDMMQSERPELLRRTIVVTASLSQRQMQRVREYPVCAIIAKPFDVEVLLRTTKSCAAQDEKDVDDDETPARGGRILSSGMILLLADLLRQKWV